MCWASERRKLKSKGADDRPSLQPRVATRIVSASSSDSLRFVVSSATPPPRAAALKPERFAVNGGLVSEIRLFAETRADYLILEAAVSWFEILMLAIAIIQLVIDIITLLFHRRNKENE